MHLDFSFQVPSRAKRLSLLLCILSQHCPSLHVSGSPATTNTFCTSSFLLSVNWITAFETVPIIINVLVIFLPSETKTFSLECCILICYINTKNTTLTCIISLSVLNSTLSVILLNLRWWRWWNACTLQNACSILCAKNNAENLNCVCNVSKLKSSSFTDNRIFIRMSCTDNITYRLKHWKICHCWEGASANEKAYGTDLRWQYYHDHHHSLYGW